MVKKWININQPNSALTVSRITDFKKQQNADYNK